MAQSKDHQDYVELGEFREFLFDYLSRSSFIVSLPNSRCGLLAMIPACGFSELYDCCNLVDETGSTLLAPKFYYPDMYEAHGAQIRL